MKKIIALIIAVAMIASLGLVSVSAATPEGRLYFVDNISAGGADLGKDGAMGDITAKVGSASTIDFYGWATSTASAMTDIGWRINGGAINWGGEAPEAEQGVQNQLANNDVYADDTSCARFRASVPIYSGTDITMEIMCQSPEGEFALAVYTYTCTGNYPTPGSDVVVGGANTGAAGLVSTSSAYYVVGSSISVSATSTNASGKDWVGIYKKGETTDPDNGGVTSIYWGYTRDGAVVINNATSNVSNGDLRTDWESYANGLPAGEYTIYLCENDGYTAIDSVDITIVNSASEIPGYQPPVNTPTGDAGVTAFAIIAIAAAAVVALTFVKRKATEA